jgi:uncharacterized membrane protein YgcG
MPDFSLAPTVFSNINTARPQAAQFPKENQPVRKTLGLVMTFVFVLSFGTLAFAQNANSSTSTDNTSGTMSGNSGGTMKKKHHRRRHHRRHSTSSGSSNTSGGNMSNGNMSNGNR